MAKFISFRVSENGSQYQNATHLLPVDKIGSIVQTADQTLVINLTDSASGADVVTLTAQTATGNPVYAAGAPLMDAVTSALTANPGGVKSSANNIAKDDAGAAVGWTAYVVS